MEDWRWVPGYEGKYEVSDQGNVRRYSKTTPPRNLKPSVQVGGYCRVTLSSENVKHSRLVHELVLTAFVGTCPPGLEARHDNGKPADNRLSNLEWATRSVNTLDQVRHGTHHMARRTECPRGHLLQMPNLHEKRLREKGHRTCLSCMREAALAKTQGRPFDIRLADARYDALMKAVN